MIDLHQWLSWLTEMRNCVVVTDWAVWRNGYNKNLINTLQSHWSTHYVKLINTLGQTDQQYHLPFFHQSLHHLNYNNNTITGMTLHTRTRTYTRTHAHTHINTHTPHAVISLISTSWFTIASDQHITLYGLYSSQWINLDWSSPPLLWQCVTIVTLQLTLQWYNTCTLPHYY